MGPLEYERLTRLSNESGRTKVARIRDALRLAEIALRSAEKGYEIAIVDKNGEHIPIPF